jgi:hypothetical protein
LPTQAIKQPCALTTEQASDAKGTGALIVSDISGSMKGFSIPGSVRLYSLHEAMERALRNAISPVEPGAAIRRCYLGENFDCDSKIPLQAMDSAATYSAAESRLDLLLGAGSQNQESGLETDLLDPHRISILISDGMQARNADASGASPCMGGADPNCIAFLLKQRAEKGYGIWMAVLLMPFKGTHFAERPLDAQQWAVIQQHIAGLGQDSYYQGVSFSVQGGSSIPFKSYTFQGVKPIMILALSRDKDLGRRFIEQFGSLVRSANIVQPANAIHTIELAPLSVKSRKISKIILAPQAEVEGVEPVEGRREGDIFDYLLDCESGGSATFIITSEESKGKQTIPDGVDVTFNLVSAVGSFPPDRLAITTLTGESYEAKLSCRQIKEGNYEAWLKLQADLKLDPGKPSFWIALSSDNMYEAPERLFGLKDVVLTVLNAAIAQPRVTDCLRFRIERK